MGNVELLKFYAHKRTHASHFISCFLKEKIQREINENGWAFTVTCDIELLFLSFD